MKRFYWVLFIFTITGIELLAQTTSAVKTGVMVVRKKQTAISKTDSPTTSNNFLYNKNIDVKPTNKREPRYKGEPYVGKAEEVEVEVSDKNKKDFHYKYLDNKLFLFGDFNMYPYELYEVKSSISQKLYMRFKKKWFELKQNPKKTLLEEIDNPSLINYLNNEFSAR